MVDSRPNPVPPVCEKGGLYQSFGRRTSGLSSDQPVADAVGVDDPAFASGGELAAQAAGVAVDRSCGDGHRVSPDRKQELLLAEHALGIAGKVDEQFVLHLAQIEVLVVEAGRVGIGVDRQRANPEHPGTLRAVSAAQDGPQAGA